MTGIIRKKEPGEAWETVEDTGGGGSGLPTGWTQDNSDPANVDTHGGALLVDDGSGNSSQLGLFSIDTSAATGGNIHIDPLGGVLSRPDDSDGGFAAFTADGSNGATVALDAGGLEITNVGGLASSTIVTPTITSDTGQLHLAPTDDLLLESSSGSVKVQTDAGTLVNGTVDGELGFFDAMPVAKPSVTGVSVDPVALSILAALAALGLVTDDT